MIVSKSNVELYHDGNFVFSSLGVDLPVISGFRSADTGVLYDLSDLDPQDIAAAQAELDADILWDGFAQEIIISHDIDMNVSVCDHDLCDIDDVQIDNSSKMSDAFETAIVDILEDEYYNYHCI